jgi:lysozyme
MKIKDIILLEILIDDLKYDEGYRPFIYDDATGKRINWDAIREHQLIKGTPTVGIGHNIEARDFSEDIINRMFLEDLTIAMKGAAESFQFYQRLSLNRRRVIVNMVFNMGLYNVKGFKKMIAAIENKDFKEASNQMLDSAWARNPYTARRARQLAKLMLIG